MAERHERGRRPEPPSASRVPDEGSIRPMWLKPPPRSRQPRLTWDQIIAAARRNADSAPAAAPGGAVGQGASAGERAPGMGAPVEAAAGAASGGQTRRRRRRRGRRGHAAGATGAPDSEAGTEEPHADPTPAAEAATSGVRSGSETFEADGAKARGEAAANDEGGGPRPRRRRRGRRPARPESARDAAQGDVAQTTAAAEAAHDAPARAPGRAQGPEGRGRATAGASASTAQAAAAEAAAAAPAEESMASVPAAAITETAASAPGRGGWRRRRRTERSVERAADGDAAAPTGPRHRRGRTPAAAAAAGAAAAKGGSDVAGRHRLRPLRAHAGDGEAAPVPASVAVQHRLRGPRVPGAGEPLPPGKVRVIYRDGRELTPCDRKKAEQEVALGRAKWIGPTTIRLRYDPFRARRTRRRILERDQGVCAYCGATGDTIDHLTPWSLGGRTTMDNCVTSCAECNFRRGNRPVIDFVAAEGITLRKMRNPVLLEYVRAARAARRAERPRGAGRRAKSS